MQINELFQKKFIKLQVTVTSQAELFKLIADELVEAAYVTSGYLSALKQRELSYPTGLITQYLNIAIPHTDASYIIQPFIYVVSLKESLLVKQMGNNQTIEVKDFFFLGITDSKKQVLLLAKLMALFMEKDFVRGYKRKRDEEETYHLILKYLERSE
ncbi:PTS sugar transporter subunit IIA [Vagococcus salmoninarum]|uniref:PTS sugar transporter subunit IIA n=1 Tax=Vagococcus salmoninarum TaxID=2739 RepID=UPI00188125F2|nr:PTS sugar transporter subunit IIA [Vagococcus salmoninarum]MBE9387768.1 PTS sugar transporter subunit IIA [Vagococcus salmoninarum]